MIPRQYLLLLLLTGFLRWAASYLTRSLQSHVSSTSLSIVDCSPTSVSPQKTLTDITTRARRLHRRTVGAGAAEIGFSALLGLIFIATRSISPVVSTGIGFVGVAVMSVGTVGSFVIYGRTVRLRRELYRLEADYQ